MIFVPLLSIPCHRILPISTPEILLGIRRAYLRGKGLMSAVWPGTLVSDTQVLCDTYAFSSNPCMPLPLLISAQHWTACDLMCETVHATLLVACYKQGGVGPSQ